MYSQQLLASKKFKVLTSIFLLLLVGCSNDSLPKRPLSSQPTSQLVQNNKAIFARNPSNQIQVDRILTIDPTSGEAISCAHTVLKDDRLTYSSDEMRKMSNYFDPLNNDKSDELTIAQGNFVEETSNWGTTLLPGCSGWWEVTNISQTPVQIAQINMQLTTDAQPDPYHYRLIDTCSLPATATFKPCVPGGGGLIPVIYTFKVKQARASTVFQSTETYGGTPTIDPGQTILVLITILPSDERSSFIYTLTPELVLSSAGQNDQVFNLTQWTSTIALVNVKQFSCYQFHGHTLVPIVPNFTVSDQPPSAMCS